MFPFLFVLRYFSISFSLFWCVVCSGVCCLISMCLWIFQFSFCCWSLVLQYWGQNDTWHHFSRLEFVKTRSVAWRMIFARDCCRHTWEERALCCCYGWDGVWTFVSSIWSTVLFISAVFFFISCLGVVSIVESEETWKFQIYQVLFHDPEFGVWW